MRSTSWASNSVGWAVGVSGTILKTTDGGASWQTEDPGTTRDLTGVSFVDANNGWISGVSATVLHTSDGGLTWLPQAAPTVPAARNLRDISFANTSVGIAAGDLGTTTSTIVYTSNGGATWKTAQTTSTAGISSVQMVSATTGWAVGSAGVILKTSDGGANWTEQPSPTVAGLSDVSFAPGGVVGYVVGNAALPNWTIYKTTDSGATWNAVNGLGATGAINLTAVHVLDANNAVCVGTNGQIRHTSDGGATWLNQSQNNLNSNALRDVKMIDANNIKAIGDFGTVFYTRNSGNFWFTAMLGNTATYYTSSFIDANHGWLAGSNGTIMRTADAGRSWETQASGITNWRGIAFADINNGWVVGDGGQIQHTSDGVNWVPQTSGVSVQLNGVSFVSTTTGLAVGSSGTILKTTNGGATWSARPSGTANGLNAVWSASASRAYAVGAGGVILRSNNGGDTWTTLTSGTSQILLSVRGVSSAEVWASGNGGTVIKTTNNGSSWSATQTTGAGSNPIRAIFPIDSSTAYYVSNYGNVSKTTNGGTTWTAQNAGLPTNPADPATGLWTCWFADANTGFLAGDSGTLRRTVDGGATYSSLQYGSLATFNGIGFADASNGWIIGTGGFVSHTSDKGQTWAAQKTGSNNALNAMSIVSSQTIWAVGDNGSIRKTTNGGLTWAGQTSGVLVNLKGISAVDTTHAVLTGVGGTIKYTADGGSTWTTGSVATTQQVGAVAMTDKDHGWAVAARIAGNNVVWRTVDGGANWSSQPTTANANFWTVYFRTPAVGFVGGDSGAILRSSDGGATWARQNTPTTLPVYAFNFVDANNGIATGGGGLVLRTSDGGTTWTLQSSGTARSLTGVAQPDATHAIISGSQGTILRNGDVVPPVTSLAVSPLTPDGTNGWYKSAPLLSLTSSKQPATSFYGWDSAAGPYQTYLGSITATQGTPTLYYYSIDASGNIEAPKSAPFFVDFTPPLPSATVTVTSIASSTAQVSWAPASDSISGVDHYDVYVAGGYAVSSATTNAVIAGLTPGTPYSVTVRTVDAASNVSSDSPAVGFVTQGVNTTPFQTVRVTDPLAPNGANGWYVTTPTITLAALPMTETSTVLASWTSAAGPYFSYTTTLTPPADGVSTLWYSAHDPAHVRTDEATQQATYQVDTATPMTPSVTATATSYQTVHLDWSPGILPTPSGTDRYDVYMDGQFLISTPSTETLLDVTGLSPSTAYSFAVYAVNGAGRPSSATLVSATTMQPPKPSAPGIVYAKSPSGFYAYVNWSVATDTVGFQSYVIWRSTDGATYTPLATVTNGLSGTQYVDATLAASQHYWYAVSTVDSRGEGSISDTSAAVWPSMSTTTTGPQRVTGLAKVETSASVVLSWDPSPNATTRGYYVLRAPASLSTPTTLTSIPVTGTTYFDLAVQNGEPYYYSVSAMDASGNVGGRSLELEARPHFIAGDESPHIVDTRKDSTACACHNTHRSTDATVRSAFPGTTKDTLCDACHAPATAAGEFLDPLAKSQHSMGATATPTQQFTCNTCHRPLKNSTEPTANLMLTNSVSPCVVVTDTPPGNSFCYKCHGVGSTLKEGDLTGFEQSAHSNIAPPPTGAGITCDTCHDSHSSRNESLLRYSGFMLCVTCHNSSQSDPNAPDIWTKLTQNSDLNAKHPLLPADQAGGAKMACENCHNTHSSTTNRPLVDPHNPGPAGEWTGTRANEKEFCFTCHDGSALPTSQETTPWADPVLASGGATSVIDIKTAYQTNVHGFGSASNSTTTTAYLRPDMGYQYGDVLECRSCHDPHGTMNNYALQNNVVSANGQKTINGVVVAPVPTGGYDLRFFCGTCHVFDSATHDPMAKTSTLTFPTNCTRCHRHMKSGVPTDTL